MHYVFKNERGRAKHPTRGWIDVHLMELNSSIFSYARIGKSESLLRDSSRLAIYESDFGRLDDPSVYIPVYFIREAFYTSIDEDFTENGDCAGFINSEEGTFRIVFETPWIVKSLEEGGVFEERCVLDMTKPLTENRFTPHIFKENGFLTRKSKSV